jgi:predicted O-methyltransferase YrrM
MRMKSNYSFRFEGTTITENSYGHGRDDENTERTYLEDLWALSQAHAGREGANILEWGSGISTLMFADFIRGNGGLLTTLDDNGPYQRAVLDAVENRSQVAAHVADLIGTRESQSDTGLNYSTLPLAFKDRFDLIYIDGRRRVECSLIAAIVADSETVVVVHDYRRTRYQPMLGLFDIVDDGPHFRVMKVNQDISSVISRRNLGEMFR